MRSGVALPTGEGPTDLYVQFVGADGAVAGASTAAQGRPALLRPGDATLNRVVTVHDTALGDLRAIAKPTPGGPNMTVVVARSASSVSRVRDTLIRLLIVMLAAGSVLLGILIWVVVGRALRPVDEMRKTVDSISERDLQRRLVDPGTGDELDRLADTLNELLERLRGALDEATEARHCSRRSLRISLR